MEQPLLLVIDDEPAIAQLISDHFEDWFQVNVAYGAKTALSVGFDHPPDICVLDYRLPDMNGMEVARQIKEKYAHVSVILITGYRDTLAIDEVLSLDGGVDYLVPKPLDMEELEEKVGICLEKGGIKQAYRMLKSYHKSHSKTSKTSQERRHKKEQRLREIERLIRRSPNSWTLGKLAQWFGVSRTQIQRDIEKLRRLNVQIVRFEEGFSISE